MLTLIKIEGLIHALKEHCNAMLFAQIAQSVEQGTENPRVRGSIPRLGTIQILKTSLIAGFFLPEIYSFI